MDFIKGFSKLFIITFALGLYGCTVFWFREFNTFIFPVISGNIQGMIRFGVFQLYKSSDITGMKFRNPCPVLAGTYIQL